MLDKLDHPVPFLIFTSMGVIGMMALFAWLFSTLNWTGPLGLVKGGQAG